jgi:hypothetical protein
MKRMITQCVLVAVALVLAGCQNRQPVGSTGGRIDPYRTTASDQASGRANIPSLLEFSEQTARRLAEDICQLDGIANSGGGGASGGASGGQRQVLELGTITNLTQTPSSDFELIQNRLRGQLLRSDLVKRNFVVVMDRQRMTSEYERLGAVGADPARYDAANTYVLQGDFHEAIRGERRQYYFQFVLTNLATRQIVFQDDYDLAQVR